MYTERLRDKEDEKGARQQRIEEPDLCIITCRQRDEDHFGAIVDLSNHTYSNNSTEPESGPDKTLNDDDLFANPSISDSELEERWA
eukprot:747939-Hanusia_phi.AAC.9